MLCFILSTIFGRHITSFTLHYLNAGRNYYDDIFACCTKQMDQFHHEYQYFAKMWNAGYII